MNNKMDIAAWFPDELSDEAACAIHLLLDEFTGQFTERYHHQIRRHIELVIEEGRHEPSDSEPLQEDDEIPF